MTAKILDACFCSPILITQISRRPTSMHRCFVERDRVRRQRVSEGSGYLRAHRALRLAFGFVFVRPFRDGNGRAHDESGRVVAGGQVKPIR